MGVLGHTDRFAVFAFFPEPAPAILVNVLHGICYAFFFATVYIFVDEYFPKDVRASAQGLFNVLILGFGPFVANVLCGELRAEYSDPATKALDYPDIFKYSMGAALVGAVILFVFFHPARSADPPPHRSAEEDAPPAP